MIAVLDDWDGRCGSVLQDLEGRVAAIREKAVERRKRQEGFERARERGRAELEARITGSGGAGRGKRGARDGGLLGEGEEMNIDEGAGRGRPRNAKRGGRFGGPGMGKKSGG